MRQLSADEIASQIHGLEAKLREDIKTELLSLLDPNTFVVQPDEEDTFRAGIEAVVQAIKSSF